ncbi:MAG TPA: glutamate--tRNA ligase [Rhodospirillaceae bacterium]|jgi:glutamyl-tRNA synthetase|nr:glutamate--tRNA ligase [Alphaproteobacteria bacterium]HBH26745.1 glutamate--tRNA ligase [Rhodospirillaceae bacterium]
MTPPVTRIAPSPTGFMHIGTARTALFNWLYARGRGGRFLLRIEDTDAARATPGAVEAILDGLTWLGLDWDGDPVFQSENAARHAQVVGQLLASGHAYRCTCTPARLAALPHGYDRQCRDAGHGPDCGPHVVRIKAPLAGEIVLDDQVQGRVVVAAKDLDDFVLLRSDGTPTYMLCVVVDDHDMGVTHVIRGDDHLSNALRQRTITDAMGWPVPVYAHIPLIHGADGKKLSKRHGAVGVAWYREQGYLPEAVCNYLLRLGWGHGDAEVISRAEALEWFDLPAVGRAPARLDEAKLDALNAHYIAEADDARLLDILGIDDARFLAALPLLKPRARTLAELREAGAFLLAPVEPDDAAREKLTGAGDALAALAQALQEAEPFDAAGVKAAVKAVADARGVKMGAVGPVLRAALTGRTGGPDIFASAAILGRDECLERLKGVQKP